MKIKKILAVVFAAVICLGCSICAFAVEGDETLTADEALINMVEIETNETNEDVDVLVSEGVDTDAPGEEGDSVTDVSTEATTVPETTTAPATTEAATDTVIETVIDKNRATIYFKDVQITCTIKIKNKDTGKVTEFEISQSNNWTYSGELEPGKYEFVSFKPKSSQHKIKNAKDADGNIIKSFDVIDTGNGIQVVNIYLTQRATTGLLAFFRKNILFDVCAVLLVILYVINAKGYRIPILSNWVDNYRN